MATNEWEKFAADNLKIELTFVGKVESALKKQISSFIDDLQTLGTDYATLQISFTAWNEHLIPILTDIYKRAGLLGAVKTYSSLKQDAGIKYRGFGFNDQWRNDVLNYLQVYMLNKAVLPISETTRQFLLKVVEDGIRDGWSIDQMVNKMTSPEINKARANTIARTEVIRAANVGHSIGASQFPYQVIKGWSAANDHRTRHSHILVNGQWVEENETFSNGLLFPGDPEGSAAEVINCRCRSIYKAKRDTQGRILPR